jgi:hypothetical protein
MKLPMLFLNLVNFHRACGHPEYIAIVKQNRLSAKCSGYSLLHVFHSEASHTPCKAGTTISNDSLGIPWHRE